MKKTILIAITTLITVNVWGQWNPATNGIYYNGGNAGIGITNPERLLDIKGNHTACKFRIWYDDRATDQYRIATIDIWASEPGISYASAGIGYNINKSPYYGIFDNINGASAIRFLKDGSIRFHSLAAGSTIFNSNSPEMTILPNGNVGIGITNPLVKLDVIGQDVNFFSGTTTNTLKIGRNENEHFKFYVTDNYGYLDYIQDSDSETNHVFYIRNLAQGSGINDIRFQTSLETRLTVSSNGNVGVGTTNPLTELQVGQNNSSKTSDELMRLSMDVTEPGIKTALHIDANPSSSSWDKGIAIELGFKSSTYNEYTSRIVHYGNSGSTRASKLQLQTHSVTDGKWNTGILIDNVGNVGIGTTTPDYKLTVDGTINCEEVKVEMIDGADFVFEDNYELRKLDELEEFVKTNKHLPEIASEKEMQANGVDMGEFQIQLLQKIEELTLYVIELKKENIELNKKMELLMQQ